jgi:acetolactate synthase-1/2/3 large subunit
MVGSHGNHAANYAMHNTDFLIILGARVGDRAMGAATKIAGKAQIVHIDIDPAEIGKNIGATIPIVGDVKNVLEEILQIADTGDIEEWVNKLGQLKIEHSTKKVVEANLPYVKPAYVFEQLEKFMDDDSIMTTEVGQNQIWAASHHVVSKPRKFISSGGMGTMGYGLPAAVGAKLGCPDKKVVLVAGDGSFQMSMQELGTIKQENLGVKMIIFNNSRLGMVREMQKTKFCGRYCQVILDQNPDFVKLVEAYGFKGTRVATNDGVEGTLKKMFEDDEPFLLEFIVDPEEPTLG